MLHRPLSLGLGLILLVPILGLPAEASDTVTLELPAGSAEAGRTAFVALSCSSCHGVAGDDDMPEPVSANRGPTLGSYQAGQTTARLGMSIFAPSHEITGTVRNREDDLSPMPDFTDSMTVRQFLDLIAYLGSLEN
jgi:mono/diheme cytochrome c family protein